MKILNTFQVLAILVLLSSCSKHDYTVFGNKSLPNSEELKSFAFAGDGISEVEKSDWSSTEKTILKEMRRRNYFFDNSKPEVLVFVTEFPENVKLLTGNKYSDGMGKMHLEPTKVKTKANTLFIQLIETDKYETLWRGFSYVNAGKLLPETGSNLISRAILNQ
ncbi:hypothetical protein [Arcticibacterium luteifluviistationis]|uniref:DUF4136 domain-containing protein n=1 Tax=Arcticibacterium luteifluviistationis TaxID=1784714 RepID=A0A2Z4GFM1_9BACT|nr:hypothetical protein [Arcticibacterium luteifluviistationis]AWV99778.1 hypothetical protein DJ013_17000 [Arcticibacterium luteifluviistationis]